MLSFATASRTHLLVHIRKEAAERSSCSARQHMHWRLGVLLLPTPVWAGTEPPEPLVSCNQIRRNLPRLEKSLMAVAGRVRGDRHKAPAKPCSAGKAKGPTDNACDDLGDAAAKALRLRRGSCAQPRALVPVTAAGTGPFASLAALGDASNAVRILIGTLQRSACPRSCKGSHAQVCIEKPVANVFSAWLLVSALTCVIESFEHTELKRTAAKASSHWSQPALQNNLSLQ